MELLSFVKEVVQNVAEQAASYRLGQSALRHLDRALWVVEKCARWAVPPPLDQDDHPQPELVRPLPWVFFLALLVTLRVTRESMSLINLVLGKPPVRSADVVMYIQSKRRYLRTLKYQGTRLIRARAAPSQSEPWYSGLRSLFEFTMCFRRSHYGNNNTTTVSNNEEVLVVRRKRVRPSGDTAASTSETTMERLIEKMMADLNADSEDDSSFTLTNATSVKSETEDSDAEHEAVENEDKSNTSGPVAESESSTSNAATEKGASPAGKSDEGDDIPKNSEQSKETGMADKTESTEPNNVSEKPIEEMKEAQRDTVSAQTSTKSASPKEETQKFIQNERCTPQKSQQSPKNSRIANGRAAGVPNRKRGLQTPRRDAEATASASADQAM